MGAAGLGDSHGGTVSTPRIAANVASHRCGSGHRML